MPSDDAYAPSAVLAVLAGMEPPRRDPGDPVVRWATEFLGLPDAVLSAPGGVPGGLPEPAGEPIE